MPQCPVSEFLPCSHVVILLLVDIAISGSSSCRPAYVLLVTSNQPKLISTMGPVFSYCRRPSRYVWVGAISGVTLVVLADFATRYAGCAQVTL